MIQPGGIATAELARREWRAHWPLVLAAVVGTSTFPIYLYTHGLFVKPVAGEFGWTRAEANSGLMVVAVIAALCSTSVGRLVDRFGSRRLAITGLFVFLGSFGSLALSHDSLIAWWLQWSAVGAGVVLLSVSVWTAVIATRFVASRGLALAVSYSGISLTSFLAPQIAGLLIDRFGWRGGYSGLAILWAAVAFPIIFLLFRDAPPTDSSRAVTSANGGNLFFADVISWRFIRIAIATFLFTSVISGVIPNLVPFLTDGGSSPALAARSAGFLGVGSLAGMLISGMLVDRLDARKIALITYSLPIVAMILLRFGEGTASHHLAAFAVGVGAGSQMSVLPYLVTHYFPLHHFGGLLGTLTALMSLISGIAPVLAGYSFDVLGHYHAAIWTALALSLFAAPIMRSLPPYRS